MPQSQWAVSTWSSEKSFLQNKFFFLDTLFFNAYLGKIASAPDFDTTSLQVWIHTEQTEMERRAKYHSVFCFLINKNGPPFKLLKKGSDYSIDKRFPGTIRFDSTFLQDNDQIGICMVLIDSSKNKIVKGDTSQYLPLDTCILKKSLWMLKSQNPILTDSNFKLMWRNVYQLPSGLDTTTFRLVVQRVPEQNDTIDRIGNSLFSSILGLTDENGNAYGANSHIFDLKDNLLLIPPFITEAEYKNNEPFSNPKLGAENINTEIYQKTQEDFNEIKNKYNITIQIPKGH